MNKQEYKHLLFTVIESAKEKTAEKGQDEMLDSFYDDEIERLFLFDDDEKFHKEELEVLFNSFQGFYKYENNSNFSTIDLFD